MGQQMRGEGVAQGVRGGGGRQAEAGSESLHGGLDMARA
jgi:hypothetical protein